MASATTTFTSTSFNSLSSTTFNRPRHSPASYVTFRRPTPSISAVYATATANETTSVGVASSSVKTSSLYEVLGIQAGATGKEIKAAYRKLARVLHPDVVACAVAKSKDATSADDFIRVHEAYATLSDPKKRADYDRMMWLQGRRLSYSPTYCTTSGTTKYGGGTTSCSGFSGYTRRTWETDQCW
ncbi:chaperone protein dnaJ 11, chloroplastic [Beta vulgaris subsp. vulgaris]|uniref:chaperone protein dnaJ 11, chloroplastic n=1 Tax=Beta vulgaris subsp. vulgaris TaxID=3555 RepID=UPI002036DC82|nr:chaperone protein dnaJ 11, chloroplastic [Beta vulgaris subsp. vulgaris]